MSSTDLSFGHSSYDHEHYEQRRDNADTEVVQRGVYDSVYWTWTSSYLIIVNGLHSLRVWQKYPTSHVLIRKLFGELAVFDASSYIDIFSRGYANYPASARKLFDTRAIERSPKSATVKTTVDHPTTINIKRYCLCIGYRQRRITKTQPYIDVRTGMVRPRDQKIPELEANS